MCLFTPKHRSSSVFLTSLSLSPGKFSSTLCSIIDTICESPLVHSGPLKSLLTLFKTHLKTPLESILRVIQSHYIGLGLRCLEFADDSVGVTESLVELLWHGGPIVGDLVIFVYSQGHMGRGLDGL